ncbi:MAG: enoyl-CoA hydratase/isomerase family protein [Acidimicrobiia bacterium]
MNYPTDLDSLAITLDTERRTATITLDDPEKHNRVSMLARDQLSELFRLVGNDEMVDVVFLKGAGDRAFTAGGDIPGFLRATPEELTRLHDNVAGPERCPKPVIALIQGYCLGVGLELSLACDFRIATDDAQIGLPEIRIGMMPGSGGTQRLTRLIGLGRAKDMIMRGRRISADEALSYGLVTEVVEPGGLVAAGQRLAAELQQHSPLAMAMVKRVLNRAYETPLGAGLELEGLAYGFLRTTHDFREGVESFVEGRPPEYTGE